MLCVLSRVSREASSRCAIFLMGFARKLARYTFDRFAGPHYRRANLGAVGREKRKQTGLILCENVSRTTIAQSSAIIWRPNLSLWDQREIICARSIRYNNNNMPVRR